MDKRRILFVIDSLNCGGAERSLVTLLRKIDHVSTQIQLLIINRGGVFEQYVPEYVDIVALPKKSYADKILWLICSIAYSVKWRILRQLSVRRHGAEVLWKTMRTAYLPMRDNYDVAVAYQQGFPSYYVSEKINAKRKIAWINTDMRKAGYRVCYNRKIYDKYHCVVAVSDILKERLVKYGYIPEEKATAIYDINDAELIRELAESPIDDIAVGPETLRLVTVGRMSPVKNYTLVVEVARILRQKGIKFVWTIVGDGAEREKVEKLIMRYGLSDNIRLMGMLPNPYPYIAQSQIYVSTSLYEGFGLTIAEAKILGRPVVTTDFPTAYGQITDGKDGIITSPDADMMADAIINLYNDRKLYEKMINNLTCDTNEKSAASGMLVDSLFDT